MYLQEILDLVNSKQKNFREIFESLGCSRDLLRSILKEHGYEYDNKNKIYFFSKEGEPINVEVEPIIQERLSKKKNGRSKVGNEKKSVAITAENNQTKIGEESDFCLTKEEIQFIKNLMKDRNQFELNHDFLQLPPKKPAKKVSYEYSVTTYKAFEKYAETMSEKYRISKNDLVEIALIRLMRDIH